MEKLKKTIEQCEIDKKHRDLVAAAAEINRMQGYNAPVKVENTNKFELDTSNMKP
jgi:hypothetical protein